MRTVAWLTSNSAALSGTERCWSESNIICARWLTQPTAWRVMRLSSARLSWVKGRTYSRGHLRSHPNAVRAEVQGTY